MHADLDKIWQCCYHISNISGSLQKLHFPIEVVVNSLKRQRSLKLVSRSQFLQNLLIYYIYIYIIYIYIYYIYIYSIYIHTYKYVYIYICIFVCVYIYIWCLHSHGGSPIAGWFTNVYFMEIPNLKWMITGGTPMTQKTSVTPYFCWIPTFEMDDNNVQ